MIYDEELTDLSYDFKINKTFTLKNIKDSNHRDNGLWSISLLGDSVLKCIPLFNCDLITSSNSEDNVLEDNKCIICNDVDNTVITCSSIYDDTDVYHGVLLHSWLITGRTVFCVAYDRYNHLLRNELIDVYVNDKFVETVTTNNNGVCKYKLNKEHNLSVPGVYFIYEIQFRKDNAKSEIITIEV